MNLLGKKAIAATFGFSLVVVFLASLIWLAYTLYVYFGIVRTLIGDVPFGVLTWNSVWAAYKAAFMHYMDDWGVRGGFTTLLAIIGLGATTSSNTVQLIGRDLDKWVSDAEYAEIRKKAEKEAAAREAAPPKVP